MSDISKNGYFIYTTSQKTASNYSRNNWIKYRPSKSIDTNDVWAFTDGSDTGWHSAIIICNDSKEVRKLASFLEKTPMRNVSSELDAMILALSQTPEGSCINIVHDYIGVGAWMVGAWKAKKQKVKNRIAKAKKIIIDRKLTVLFIHHKGHQSDQSDFTKFNNLADQLCSDGVFTDNKHNLSEF